MHFNSFLTWSSWLECASQTAQIAGLSAQMRRPYVADDFRRVGADRPMSPYSIQHFQLCLSISRLSNCCRAGHLSNFRIVFASSSTDPIHYCAHLSCLLCCQCTIWNSGCPSGKQHFTMTIGCFTDFNLSGYFDCMSDLKCSATWFLTLYLHTNT